MSMQTSHNGNESNISEEIWLSAMDWVRFHMYLVHWVADPYLPYMAADEDDLFHEAILAAVKAMLAAEKKNSPQKFIPFFRVIFKTHCLKLAAGIQPALCSHEFQLSSVSQEEEECLPEPEPEEIEAALQSVGGRRQEVCAWILDQPRPVSTLETARHFQVSQRQVCRIVNQTLNELCKNA